MALILTIQLSLLSVLNSYQNLATEVTAESNQHSSLYTTYLSISKKTALWTTLLVPCLILLSFAFNISEKLNLNAEQSFYIFLLGFPAYFPLAIWRGFAQGRIDIRPIVISANAEMLVRLLGGVLLYWLGFGLEGVVFAFTLSVFVALFTALPAKNISYEDKTYLKNILPFKKVAPWAFIQLSVVLLLDGEILLGKIYLDAEQAGFLAGLGLIQRIIFYASFALAGIVLPNVIKAIKEKQTGIKETTPALLLILLSSCAAIIMFALFPHLLIDLLFGNNYASIAPQALYATIGGSLITLNYFLITFLMAHKSNIAKITFCVFGFLQIAVFFVTIHFWHFTDLTQILLTKISIQILLLAILLIIFNRTIIRKNMRSPNLSTPQ